MAATKGDTTGDIFTRTRVLATEKASKKKLASEKTSAISQEQENPLPHEAQRMPTSHSVEDILSELRSQRTELNTKLDAINSQLSAIGGKVTILENALPDINNKITINAGRLDEAEGRILSMENLLTDAMETIAYAKKKIEHLEEKTEDLENRGRRNNCVLFNLGEKEEGNMPLIRYLQDKLPEWLHMSTDRPIELERAHRALRPPPAARQPPRPITIRFLRFTDKERVLQAAKNNTITVGNAKLALHQDLSAGIRRKRREFDEVKKYSIDRGIFRGFKYPNELRILHQGALRHFKTPEEAKRFLKDNPGQ